MDITSQGYLNQSRKSVNLFKIQVRKIIANIIVEA